MATPRTGLPRPIVENVGLQQWIDGISALAALNPDRTVDSIIEALIEKGLLDRRGNLLDRQGQPFTGGGGVGFGVDPAGRIDTGAPDIPTLAQPPQPTGFVATGGINIAVLHWDSPFQIYANHGRTRVWRHTADELNNATEVGASTGVTFIDDTVEEGQTYWYWIRWESSDTPPVLGPPTDGQEARTGATSRAADVDTPGKPTGFRATGAINIVILGWDNPNDVFGNYRQTRIYRHTADDFSEATEIATSEGSSYIDETVQTDRTYWYWIRWETRQGTLGPESDSARARTGADEGLDDLAVSSQPTGFDVQAGIGVVILTWDNPYAIYANHGLTRIYRHTSNDLSAATEIGTAAGVSFIDETPSVAVAETLWYWIRWETNVGAAGRGPATDGVMVTTFIHPRAAIEQVSREILDDPLTRELLTPIGGSPTDQRVAGRLADLRARILDSIALSLDGRIETGERVIVEQGKRLSEVESKIEGTLGPEQNIFVGDTRAEAEAARDAYAAANPAWVNQYQASDSEIELRWLGSS